jgi:pyruvate kinase
MRRAKIVCTLGPACDSLDAIRELVEAGMNVARLNFSHGTVAEHAQRLERVRAVGAELGRPLAILQDLCGPKIRTGQGGPKQLVAGAVVELAEAERGSDTVLAVNHPAIRELEPGDRILLSDGQIELAALEVTESGVRCKVVHGGALRARMGVNLPAHRVRGSAITAKDREDLAAGLELGVDYVALSFVRSAADIEELRGLCEKAGRPTPLIAKIETPAAVGALDEVVRAADAVMVARGDLGVELAPEVVPVVQRQILAACRKHRKPVIVATEMLHSMIEAPRPTRAEASDVAGAVFDGADALMLSGETATGKHPKLACAMMARIIREAEKSPFFAPLPAPESDDPPDAIAHAACDLARSPLGVRLIVALTQSGGTARLISKARPPVPIVAFSPEPRTLSRLALYWGVDPRSLDTVSEIEELAERVRKSLTDGRLVEKGDRYVMAYGAPVGAGGATNAVRLEHVR